MSQTINFLGENYGISLWATSFMWLVSTISQIATWIQGLTTIGAFIVVVLTIYATAQRIKLNTRKLKEYDSD